MPTSLPRSPAAISTRLSLLLAALIALLLAPAPPAIADPGADDATDDGVTVDAADDEEDDDASLLFPYFEDTADRGYNPAVIALASERVLRGCETLLFCPEEEVTRGQLATMLVNALGLEPAAEGPFNDTAGNIHEQEINAIAAAGITVGCEEAAYCPQDTITREQYASLLVGAFELPATDVQHFDGLSETHGDNVNSLADAGITDGCLEPLTSFCDEEPVLRWHAASFLARTMQLVERVEITPLEERRAQQERIDAEREAEREAERQAEQERLEAERAAADPWGISELSDERIAMWERLAGCESNNDWTAVSANGLYYGGLQFHPDTWRGVGGTGMPNDASRAEQIYRAERLLENRWATFSNQWPACSRMLGLG